MHLSSKKSCATSPVIRIAMTLLTILHLHGEMAADAIANTSHAENNHAVQSATKKYSAGEIELRKELQAALNSHGENSPQVLAVLQRFTDYLQKDEKRNLEYLELHRRMVAIARVFYGDKHPVLGQKLARYGIALTESRNYSEADKVIQEALDNIKNHYQISDKDLLELRDALAKVHLATQRADSAVQLLKKNLSIREKLYGTDSPSLLPNLMLLGRIYMKREESNAALPLFRRSVSISEKNSTENPRQLVLSLNDLAEIYRALGQYKQAEPLYRRVLEIIEQEKPVRHDELGIILNNLASLYVATARYQDALPLYERSLKIAEKLTSGNGMSVVRAMNNLAILYQHMGDYRNAIIFLRKAMNILEKRYPHKEINIASVLGNMSVVYKSLGEYEKAISTSEKVLAIKRKLLPPTHPGIAFALQNLANHYGTFGQHEKAKNYEIKAIAIFEKNYPGGHPDLASAYGVLGSVHRSQGNYSAALEMYHRSLSMRKKMLPAVHPAIALGLDQIAGFYREMGRNSEALSLYTESYEILKKAYPGGHPTLASSLDRIANMYKDERKYKKALQLYEKSLAIRKRFYKPTHSSIGSSYNNLGLIYDLMKDYHKGIEYYEKSYAIWKKSYGTQGGYLATNRNNMGAAYVHLKQYQKAIDAFHETLVLLSCTSGSQTELSRTQNNLKIVYWKMGQLDLAILWGKEAVNTIQHQRGGLKGLDKDLQKGFLKKRRYVYQGLADLLIQVGRLQEAQAVLQMLKEDELHNTLKRSTSIDPRTTRIELNGLEHKSFAQYYRIREQQVALVGEHEALLRKKKLAQITPAEIKRLEEIGTKLLPPLRQAMQVFLSELQKNLTRYANEKAYRKRDASLKLVQTNLQKALVSVHAANPDAKVVAIQYVVTDERLSILLSTPNAPPLARQLPLDALNLRKRVLSIRGRLSNPRSDRKLLLQELQQLYKLLIEPVATDLKTYGAETMVLVPNDVLRYVPFAALHNGKRYLVQDYTLTLFNEAVKKDFTAKSASSWRLVAMGLTRAVEDLPALPSVREEVTAITTRAGLVGTAYLDDQFTRTVLYNSLKQNYNVLHLASHFVFVPGRPDASRIFLGDRSPLTLGDIARANLRFDPFSLVTFSACESGLGGGLSADGRDMESLGALVQTQGARAVIATLWKVEDSSTASLMENFYRSHEEEQLGKAQALRQAQLRFIKRGEESVLAHPYYWAPFILMGDWR